MSARRRFGTLLLGLAAALWAGNALGAGEAPTHHEPPSLLAAPPAADFGPTRLITLLEALDLAVAGNLDLALSQADEAVAKTRAQGARAGLLPSLELDAGASHTDGLIQGAYGDFRDTAFSSHRVGAGLTYGVNPGAQIKAIAAARKDLAAAVYGRLATEQRLILRVVELYEELQLAAVAHTIAGQKVADSEQFEHIATVRADGGLGLGADASRAKALTAASKQDLVAAEAVWKDISVGLAVVLRLDPNQTLDPSADRQTVWSIAPKPDLDQLQEFSRTRPDVESARQSAAAAQSRVERAWWDLFGPRLSAELRYSGVGGHGAQTRADDWALGSAAEGSIGRSVFGWNNAIGAAGTGNFGSALSTAAGSAGRAASAYKNLLNSLVQDPGLEGRSNVGVALTWSFSFAKAASLRESKLIEEQSRLRVTQLEELAAGELARSANALSAASKQIQLAQDELAAATDNHRMRLARFQAGTALALEVIDAEDAIAQARLRLAQHIADFNVAQARMLAASGLIDRKHFVAPVP